MSTVSITGKDTVIIRNRVMLNLADGDAGALTHPNESMTVKTGKDGNTLYSFNYSGDQCELVLRTIRGSADDRFLNSEYKRMKADPASYVLLDGKFVKRVGNGIGFVTNDTYLLIGGVIFKNSDSTSNAEGNTDQSLSIWSFRFGKDVRSII